MPFTLAPTLPLALYYSSMRLLLFLSAVLFADPPYEYHSLQEHYNLLVDAIQTEKWNRAVYEGEFITSIYPFSPFTNETHYFLGIAHFRNGDYELANRHLTKYMRSETTPKHFAEAIEHKFAIAKLFETKEAKKHLFGLKRMPQWLPDRQAAIEIFDEVIAAMPRSELAAEALFRKGNLLTRFKEYKESIDAYQTVIRRFPKSPYAPDSYVGIAAAYLKECLAEFPDPDRLHLAELNLERFVQDFPSEPRIAEVYGMLDRMREAFAKELFEVGSFYQRTKKYTAAKVYYENVIALYPTTPYAYQAAVRLEKLPHPK